MQKFLLFLVHVLSYFIFSLIFEKFGHLRPDAKKLPQYFFHIVEGSIKFWIWYKTRNYFAAQACLRRLSLYIKISLIPVFEDRPLIL